MNGPTRHALLPSLASPLVNQLPFRLPASVSAQATTTPEGIWVIDFIGPSYLRWTLNPVDAIRAANAWALAIEDYLDLSTQK